MTDTLPGKPGGAGGAGGFGSPGKAGEGGQGGSGGQGGTGGTGEQGEQGDPGDPGLDGLRGRDAPDYRGWLRMLTIGLAFFAIAVVLGGVAIIRVQQQARYEGCLSGVAALEIFNGQQQKLADIDKQIKENASPEQAPLIQERINAYEGGIFPVPDCEPLKPAW